MSALRVGGPSLSPEQAAAAHAGPQGAFLIAAGPGTGKTFTATERFCWLVEQGVAPDQILTLTFSDRAAEELRLRITAELGARRPDLATQQLAGRAQGAQILDSSWIGTFHGVCARLLDEFAYLVGAPREMRVLDETGQKLFQQQLIAKLRSGAAAPFLERRFHLARSGASGAEPVYTLVGREGPGLAPEGRMAAFVGRRQELELLRSRLASIRAGHGQIVGIVGEAGLGKSRLLHEFRQTLRGHVDEPN